MVINTISSKLFYRMRRQYPSSFPPTPSLVTEPNKDKDNALTQTTVTILLNHCRIATNAYFKFRFCSGREIQVCSEKPPQIHVALRTDGMHPPLTKHKLLSLRTYSPPSTLLLIHSFIHSFNFDRYCLPKKLKNKKCRNYFQITVKN